MAFKGKQLIDSAKVKNLAAQYNKIVAAINTFYERYGFYPGDGCNNTPKPSTPLDCDMEKDGILKNANETKAFWHLLINVTGLLTRADRKSVFGQEWHLWEGSHRDLPGTWLDLPGGEQADARIVCALDKLIDDGNSEKGIVRCFYNNTNIKWDENTDCWNNVKGQCNVIIRVLP